MQDCSKVEEMGEIKPKDSTSSATEESSSEGTTRETFARLDKFHLVAC